MSSLPDVSNMQRPRRKLGEVLREMISCPLCPGTGINADVRIVRWRERTVRMECVKCGLRFSLDIPELVKTLRARPDDVIGSDLRKDDRSRLPGTRRLVFEQVVVARREADPAAWRHPDRPEDEDALLAAIRELADWIEHVHTFAPSPVSTPPSRTK